MKSGSFHSRKAGDEPSSSNQVERWRETATGICCPVAGSIAIVRPTTGPCTVRSIWMVMTEGAPVPPGDGLAIWRSVRSYIGVQTPR